jgi:2-dehydro-3-deoxy-D-arabinonate dehydratase
MKLYRTAQAPVLEEAGLFFPLPLTWDELINHVDLPGYLRAAMMSGGMTQLGGDALAPVESQEVWAAGVTYLRSRAARVEESQDAGGGSCYDRVYVAERPELFFKAAPWRVRGPGAEVRIRADAKWSVPEPELALYLNARAEIIGYTIGNDVSSRDIEGENPLYLPQAKTYDGSCALGPAVLVSSEPLPPETTIELQITRDGATVFEGSTTLAHMRRTPSELVDFLYRETSFPDGCVLLTGTGVIPPDEFTLHARDRVEIRIAPIGTLINTVE